MAGNFIWNNYRQALKILTEYPARLEVAKAALNIESDSTFLDWRLEEKQYLLGLKKEPETDILRFEYLQTLQKLKHAR